MSRLRVPARIAIGAALAALAGLATAGCAGGQIAANVPQSSGQSFVSRSYESTFYQVGHRSAAPAVSGTTITGQRLSLDSYKGKTVVLNFWGSWCPPCRSEAPTLAALSAKYSHDGVSFLGVDVEDTPVNAGAFEQGFGITYPSLNDPGQAVAQVVSSAIPITSTPTTLVIDPAGHVAGAIFGTATYSVLNEMISKVAA